MALFSDSDLAAFLDTDDLGTSANYKEGGTGVGKEINTVFANNYVSITGGTVDIEGTYPVATCRTSDLGDAAHGDTMRINSTDYVVIGVQPNSVTGITKLVLNEQ